MTDDDWSRCESSGDNKVQVGSSHLSIENEICLGLFPCFLSSLEPCIFIGLLPFFIVLCVECWPSIPEEI